MSEDKQQEELNTKELQERLTLAEKERDEYLAGWKRAKADLVNFKRETAEVIGGLSDIIRAEFIKSLLPVLDAFDESNKNNIEGLKHISDLFNNILRKGGLEAIATVPGDEFNPEIHEAMDGEGERVGEVLQKGYKFKEQVIRPVKVKVREYNH